ncbi:TraB/GumN family protein [Anaerobacillus alkalidiazotrophicus]|uniref:TraB/GumN family protein n=1 Tax=Anaerobacillus alkalidiazotrophicus TaxID=472963 RepID=UPI000A0702F7|nr:TraB/GumN family protein [Anaerobacillus alkalidiazotrophicus]
MKRVFLGIFMVWALFVLGACNSESVNEDVESSERPGGFLWKVEDGETTVYLQGTVHAGTEDFYPFHETIEQAYEEADVVVPEIDITDLDLMAVQTLIVELGLFQDGSKLEDHLPQEVYSKISDTLDDLGLPLEMFESYQPWLLAITIQQLILEKLDYIHGVDEYFLIRANDDGKEIIELESMESQFQIFADMSLDLQIEFLEDSLSNIEEYEEEMIELFTYYKNGDIDGLLELLIEVEGLNESEEAQKFTEALNDKRNYEMAEKIIEFLQEDSDKTYFVIVGSLHLIMEPHIVSILEAEGYEVEHIH